VSKALDHICPSDITAALKLIDQSEKSGLKLQMRIGLVVLRNALAVLPKLTQHAGNRAGVLDFDEGAHVLGLRRAVKVVLLLIDRDPLIIEEVSERAIREVENVPASHIESVLDRSFLRVLQLHHDPLALKWNSLREPGLLPVPA
jgi:hypothetical protein